MHSKDMAKMTVEFNFRAWLLGQQLAVESDLLEVQ